ncbi:hypothetical protein [Streptomyces katrae]|uniref:Uncharacterized protein n=1 Tax=Streptomyces katrae TaxID=68223 RepID=A0A0F4JH50_9ACTN|nr:hypothetical protein [Streptomyces katrae]KJY33515.1 hypothetical protein VR44_13760 [Streptomyces katrae]
MNEHGIPGAPEGFTAFGVAADWPQSRQVTGHGHSRLSGDAHVYLWYGSPHFDPEVEHVTVCSASSGNPEAEEALRRGFEDYFHIDQAPWTSLPAPEPVTVTADGKPVGCELWRDSGRRCWVARGRAGAMELVLSGSGIDPEGLGLVSVSDLTCFSGHFGWRPGVAHPGGTQRP